MARKPPNTVRVTKSIRVNNLKLIKGIGPTLEKRLHDAGIYTFSGLAALSAEEIASIIPGMSAQQITKQGWITQARKLTLDKAKSRIRLKENIVSTSRRHYENFTFEFLLDEKNKTRRIRVVHVQSGDVDTWGKWDIERLFDFLARHTGSRLKCKTSTIPKPSKPQLTTSQFVLPEPSSTHLTETTFKPSVGVLKENSDYPSSLTWESISKKTAPSNNITREISNRQASSPLINQSSVNKIHLMDWKIVLDNTDQSLNNIPPDQPFDIRLTLDPKNLVLPDGSNIEANGTLYAKKLSGGQHQLLCETHGAVPYAKTIYLTFCNARLSAGYYRLEALVSLKLIGMEAKRQPEIMTFMEVGFLQVY